MEFIQIYIEGTVSQDDGIGSNDARASMTILEQGNRLQRESRKILESIVDDDHEGSIEVKHVDRLPTNYRLLDQQLLVPRLSRRRHNVGLLMMITTTPDSSQSDSHKIK